jgi:hypothetical protein
MQLVTSLDKEATVKCLLDLRKVDEFFLDSCQRLT